MVVPRLGLDPWVGSRANVYCGALWVTLMSVPLSGVIVITSALDTPRSGLSPSAVSSRWVLSNPV